MSETFIDRLIDQSPDVQRRALVPPFVTYRGGDGQATTLETDRLSLGQLERVVEQERRDAEAALLRLAGLKRILRARNAFKAFIFGN